MLRIKRAYYPLCRNRLGHVLARWTVRGVRKLGGLRNYSIPIDALELAHSQVRVLSDLWSRIHWSAGDGMMPAEQLLAIFRLTANWPIDGDVVELGSWTGLTTCYLAAACRSRGKGRVFAVDTFSGIKEDGGSYASAQQYGGSTLGTFSERVRRSGLDHLITPLVGRTTDVAKTYPGDAIRVLLIDADHSFEGVRDDFESWLPDMATGGLMIFHDYLMPGVADFVNKVVVDHQCIRLTPGHIVPNVMAVTVAKNARSTISNSQTMGSTHTQHAQPHSEELAGVRSETAFSNVSATTVIDAELRCER